MTKQGESERHSRSRSRRDQLVEQSLLLGGFGDGPSRRSAWLFLLDLADVEARLPPYKQELSPSSSQSHIDVIPLDSEGWQIATHNLDASLYDDSATEHESSAWSVASSKRSKRTKRTQDSLHPSSSTSGTVTASSSSRSRDASTSGSGHDAALGKNDLEEKGGNDSAVNGASVLERTDRKARKRHKKKKANSAARHDDLHSSIVHVDHGQGRAHKDEEQVALDIKRSFIPLGNTPLRATRQAELSRVVNGVLQRYPKLHYYQGYHDVISVLLVVMIPHTPSNEERLADEVALDAVIDVASRLSLHFLRDAMMENMTPTLGHLKVLRNIVRRSQDEQLAKRVEQASPLPYFALPWLLSMFSHELDERLACLVFDYLLPRGPTSLLYLCAALIERNQEDVKTLNVEDSAEVHHVLAQLPTFISEATLPGILRNADRLAKSSPLADRVMGKGSVLYSWTTLPWHDDDWNAADERASAILQGSVDDIVVDALPSPPPSERGDASDELIHDDKSLVARRWWRKSVQKRAAEHRGGLPLHGGGALVAWLGAVGALSAALIIMYGANGYNVSGGGGSAAAAGFPASGLGSAFPVGFRAAETIKLLFRNGFYR